MNVLCIDTSNQPMSIAVYKENELAGEITINIKRNHSIQLMPNIEHLMQQANLKPKDLDQMVVADGPGSFTGIRIGMTTAKTMAWTLNIPIKTVSSLKLIGASLLYQNGLVCPFFDARRGNVYTGLYRVLEGEINTIEDDCNIDMASWLTQVKDIDEKIFFISPNGENFKELIEQELGEKAVYVEQPFQLPRASLLWKMSQSNEESPIHLVKPNYHRKTEAENNWLKQNGEGSHDERG
ncbi:tRNA (adenosine(37)-N6)-threonylcarbamoyltransferase complex dimerization subunit type 1 TsaB [Piscibacillus halophilus]|uniref:tRNA threonylcarbamoyladenosine biosynthesis protein TsaB n=1 Tax=Piscibacillus halophilus TaxID=571933 RepID=A0A1H9G2F9_9BACI|nr:tRNA (adenosine(37)-N6)-threonylcarbamoyltransferase complex dimerization subunit type 1 TsaB [Piscibacillus halophilus]SEQ44332.1 tRNA threonylcarbamoyladenosine biosynthesis protein TsaB [Piscibacillus halophilus]